MTSLDTWLDQKNITDIKRGNNTHYLILEGMDSIGHGTLLAYTEILSVVKPPDVVWLWVCCFRQTHLFDRLSWDEVLLPVIINNEMEQGPLHPHLWMEDALPLFRIYWFFWLNCCGRDSRNGVCIDHPSVFNILLDTVLLTTPHGCITMLNFMACKFSSVLC